MAAKRLAGVAGVLGSVVSAPHGESSQQSETDGGNAVANPDRHQARRTLAKKRPKTRLGRPPGPTRAERPEKRKATVWIKADVLDNYHDWSWDERCQLGELIERALVDYRDRKRGR